MPRQREKNSATNTNGPHPPAARRFIADRAHLIDSSGVRKVFDLAAKLSNPVDLSIGQPCHDVPEPVKESAICAIRAGNNRYTPTQGRADLVAALTEHVAKTSNTGGRKLFITSGVSGGLFLAFATLLDPGDEVIMGDPYFVIYWHGVRFFGGVPVPVDTYPDFHLTADRIEPHITSRTKIIIVASPANPTGAVAAKNELEEIAELARKHNLLIISDEIYSVFTYDGPAPSIAPLFQNTLLLAGFSKSHAAPGWRIGYAFGPADIIDEMTKIQQYSYVCAPAPAQAAILENLDLDTRPITETYSRKRKLICDGLKDKYDFAKPGGAFYLFPKAPWGTDIEFVEEAIRNNLLVIPGSIFSRRNTHFRISYAADDDTIRRGIDILNRLAER